MRLLLMRHASAARGGACADLDRPLLPEGELQAEWAGRALRRGAVDVARAWTSPARRCRHTAEIVAGHLGALTLQVREELAPGRGGEGMAVLLHELWCSRPSAADTTWIVAHQPDLEELAAALLGASPVRPLSLQPGGCALLHLSRRHESLRARLQWLLTPAWFELVAGI